MPLPEALGRELTADPLIDQLYEMVRLYGITIKILVEEAFGDRFMSVNDFALDLTRQPRGDRVKSS
jgi:cyanate lyase